MVQRLLHDEVSLRDLMSHSTLHPVENRCKQVPHRHIIGPAGIVKPLQVVEHLLYLWILLMNPLEQLLSRSVKARLLDLFHLIFVGIYMKRAEARSILR